MMITKFLTPVSIILANLYRFKKFGENNIMWNSPWKRKENAKLKYVKVFRKVKVRILFSHKLDVLLKNVFLSPFKEDRNTLFTLTVR